MKRETPNLSDAMRAVRESAPQAPPFARVWRAAHERQQQRRARRPRVAGGVLLAAALVGLLLWSAPGGREPVPELSAEAYELAHALSTWEAPLDFLLEAPGGGLLGYQLDSSALLHITIPNTEETLR